MTDWVRQQLQDVILETNVARIALQRFSMAEGERIPRHFDWSTILSAEPTRHQLKVSFSMQLLLRDGMWIRESAQCPFDG